MKKNNTLWLLLLALCSIFAACKKDHPSKTELEKLPPATQTGANTFGCLLNGKAWVAQTDCKYLCDPAFKIYYDAAQGGSLSLIAVYLNNQKNINQKIIISFDSTNFKMVHIYQNSNDIKFAFTNYLNPNACNDIHSVDSLTSTVGKIILTRYDLTNGIISGNFDFMLSFPNCSPISFTNGRFDYKLF